MKTQWIVIADAAAARFYARTPNGELKRQGADYHDESRQHEGDLRTGGKGEVHDSAGSGQHQADPQTRTSEKHADIFAKQVAAKLKSAHNDKAFDELVLVAAPSFLGHLRDKLDKNVADVVAETIDKDWTSHDDEQIARQLNDKVGI